MKFQVKKELINIGIIERTSTKTNNQYRVIKLLDDSGQIIDALFPYTIKNQPNHLEKLLVTLEITVGKYTNVSVIELE